MNGQSENESKNEILQKASFFFYPAEYFILIH